MGPIPVQLHKTMHYPGPLSEVLGHPDVQVPDACAQDPAKDAVTSHKGIAGELGMSWTCCKCE